MNNLRDRVFRIIDNAENGNIGMMEAATELKDLQAEMKMLSDQIDDWITVNKEELISLAREYDMQFGHYRFEYRNGAKRWNFKNVPQWAAIEKDKKDLESQLITAWEASQKGLVTGTIEGEEVILPEVKYGEDVLIWKRNG